MIGSGRKEFRAGIATLTPGSHWILFQKDQRSDVHQQVYVFIAVHRRTRRKAENYTKSMSCHFPSMGITFFLRRVAGVVSKSPAAMRP